MKDILLKPGGTSLKDFLASLVIGLQTNGDSLKIFETGEKKRATWNGQKMVLQAALNDIFGIATAPYIIIETNQGLGNNLYFYEPSELSPVYFSEPVEADPVYTFEDSETGPIDEDFKILVPIGIDTVELERQIKAQTNLYKLAGTRFIIQTY
jgi:hypothetical protein